MRGACWLRRSACPVRSCSARPRHGSAPSRPTRSRDYVGRRARARARVAHSGRARILRPHLQAVAGDPRSAAGQRDADRGDAGLRRQGRPARRASAHSRRRHGQRLPAGDAAVRAAQRDRASAPTSARMPCARHPTTHSASASPHARRGKIADALESIEGPFDILVCNPPYIRSAVIAELEPEVRDFDPRAALDGGSDGLAIYRRMAPRIPALVPNGWAVFEVGYDQAEAVADLLASATGDRNRQPLSLHMRCRRKETLCCLGNTCLRIRAESPWILPLSAIVLPKWNRPRPLLRPVCSSVPMWDAWTDAKQVELLATRRRIVSTTYRPREAEMA